MLQRVDQPDDARLLAYTQLTNRQLRNRLEPEQGIFIAEGAKVIDLAVARGCRCRSLLLEERWLSSMEGLIRRIEADDPTTPIFVAPPELLATIAGYKITRGALGAFGRPTPPSPDKFLEACSWIAVLVGITNVMNVGSIFRNAAALGMDGVLLDPTCADPLYRRSLRVSMGAALTLPWRRFGEGASPTTGLAELFSQLAENGYQSIALALTPDAVDLGSLSFNASSKLAFFLGTEGEGLPNAVIDRCDLAAKIPMARGLDSLNVAAASAIAFWQLRHQAASGGVEL